MSAKYQQRHPSEIVGSTNGRKCNCVRVFDHTRPTLFDSLPPPKLKSPRALRLCSTSSVSFPSPLSTLVDADGCADGSLCLWASDGRSRPFVLYLHLKIWRASKPSRPSSGTGSPSYFVSIELSLARKPGQEVDLGVSTESYWRRRLRAVPNAGLSACSARHDGGGEGGSSGLAPRQMARRSHK